MEQVLKEYGKLLLEMLAMGLLVTLLFSTVRDDAGNQGIFEIVGANLQTGDRDYDGYADYDRYIEESKKEAPVIVYDDAVTMIVGVNKVTDYIRAFDFAGKELPIKVCSIKNPYDVDLIDTYDPDTAEIEFSQPGIYIMELSVVDGVNKKSVRQIRIPVNQL